LRRQLRREREWYDLTVHQLQQLSIAEPHRATVINNTRLAEAGRKPRFVPEDPVAIGDLVLAVEEPEAPLAIHQAGEDQAGLPRPEGRGVRAVKPGEAEAI